MRLCAVAAFAAILAVAPATAKEKKPVDPNKKVCRSETPTGSMMSKSICHTVAEWQEIDGVNARNTDAFDQQRNQSVQQH